LQNQLSSGGQAIDAEDLQAIKDATTAMQADITALQATLPQAPPTT
jgi:hypothetical protein